MTVDEIDGRAGATIANQIKAFKEEDSEVEDQVQKFRDSNKVIGPQLATPKKWIAEADAMEAEG